MADSPLLDERFRVLRELGRGAMGRVLLAMDPHAAGVPGQAPGEAVVAIKILGDPELRASFLHEFRLLRRLAHPAFVQARELGLDGASGALYSVLEACQGLPLEPGSVPDREELLEVTATLLRAIDHLHRLGYVHGDLAPPNVVLSAAPDGLPPIKILDLGAAGRHGAGEGTTSGILTYTAPERLEGASLSPAGDLWSIGVLLFGLVHGRHPFPDYPAGVPRAQRDGLAPDPLDPWLDRLLDPRPAERFPSASAALAALEDLAERPLPLVTPAEMVARFDLLPFVDVGGRLEMLESRLRAADDASRSQAVSLGGPPGVGRSRLLVELGHRLVARGVRVVRERVHEGDGPGEVLQRLLRRLGGAAPDGDGPMAAARALSRFGAMLTGSSVAVLIDDVDQGDEVTRRAVDLLTRAATRGAGRLLLVTTATAGSIRLEPWDAAAVEDVLHAVFPDRRVGNRVAAPIAERARGLPAVLVHVLRSLAGVGAIEANAAAVQLCSDASAADALPRSVADADAATLRGLAEEARREAWLLAHARGPVPPSLLTEGLHELLRTGLAVIVEGQDGPLATLRSQSVARLAAEGGPGRSAHQEWADRWGEVDHADARVESAWHALHAGAEDSVRRAAEQVRAGAAAAAQAHVLVAPLLERGWPVDAADALCAAQVAERGQQLDTAVALYREAAEDRTLAAEALARIGRLEARQARHAAAIEAYQAALVAGGAALSAVGRAALLAGLARSAAVTGKLDEAATWSAEGLELATAADREVRAGLLYSAGLACWYRGELDEADRRLTESLEAVGPDGDAVERGAVVTALGLVAHRRGRLDQAAERYREALAIGEGCGDDARVLTALQNLGVVLHERGVYTEALETYHEAFDLADALDQTGRVIQLAGNLGNLWRYLGELDRSRAVLQRGLDLARREGNRFMEGLLLVVLGEVALSEERWPLAERLLRDAVQATEESQSATEEAEARLDLIRLHLARQDYDAARREAARAAPAAERSGNAGLHAQALALWSAVHRRSVHGDPDASAGYVARAMELLDEVNNPDLRWPVVLEAFHDARRREDLEAAGRYAAEVRRGLRQLQDAVPARHRTAFRALRERRSAWQETVWPPAATVAGADAEPGDQRWGRLLEVNKRLSTERSVQRLLEYIMDSAILLSGAERGFLLLADDRSQERMDVRVARNLDRENIRNTRFKISHGIASRVIDTGDPIVTVDAMEDERYRDQLSVHDLRLRSVLCVPMLFRGRVLGAIYLDNRFRVSAFSQDIVRLMEAFADQAAVALDNARLVEAMERSQSELVAARQEVEALNAKLEAQLRERTRELEDTHRVVIRQQRQLEAKHRYDRIIGESDAIRAVFRIMDRLLDNDIPVLIEGESGTGKELVARAIHFNGPRRDKAFVAVNCGAIPANLLESELFGHVRGAFTGATSDKQGLFQAAHRGTLLLDELGELPLEMQVKLLRVLQSGDIKKVGATREVNVDVRIVAATNRNLEQEVKGGRFREDLYYRLAVIPIRLPPLRERKTDIPLLAQHFIEENRESGIGDITGISREAMQVLSRYHWPGNVRQLEMVLKNATLFADGSLLEPQDFQSFPDLAGTSSSATAGGHLSGRRLSDIEREAIIQALHDTRGNKKRAAEQLGIDRRTLYNKLSAYHIVVEKELKVR